MQDVKEIAELWPVFGALLGYVIWLVRLEGRVNQADRIISDTQRDVEALRIKHENLDSKIIQQLAEVRESLARLEGALGVQRKS
jgi:hypothetical protein